MTEEDLQDNQVIVRTSSKKRFNFEPLMGRTSSLILLPPNLQTEDLVPPVPTTQSPLLAFIDLLGNEFIRVEGDQ